MEIPSKKKKRDGNYGIWLNSLISPFFRVEQQVLIKQQKKKKKKKSNVLLNLYVDLVPRFGLLILFIE